MRIVVGVDGSPGADAALRWAVAEAAAHNAELKVVHAWHAPIAAASPWVGISLHAAEFEQAAKLALERAVQQLTPDSLRVAAIPVLAEGNPGAVLVEQSKDADLVVVGSRGHGGMLGLLLGSVAQQVAHHASCPVTIVKGN